MSDDDFDLDLDFGDDFDVEFGSSLTNPIDPIPRILDHLTNFETNEAIQTLEELKSKEGATPIVRHLLALCFVRVGRVVPGIRLLRTAHEDNPNVYEHVELLACLLAIVGQQTESVYFAKLSTALRPDYPQYQLIPFWVTNFSTALMMTEEDPVTGYACSLMEDKSYDLAEESFIDALELNKEDCLAWEGIVKLNQLTNRPGKSLKAAEALVDASRETPASLTTLAYSRLHIGDIEGAWDAVGRALEKSGPDISVTQLLPGMVRYDSRASLELSEKLSRAWRDLANIDKINVTVKERPNQDVKFRVGILSGKIHAGSDKIGILSTLEECIGRAAHLYYYSNNDEEDSVSRRLRRSAVRWCATRDVDDETVATIIRNDEVQILIDLDGFDWTGRPGVAARHPAPVLLSVFAEKGATPSSSALVLNDSGIASTDRELQFEEGLTTWPLFVKKEDSDLRKRDNTLMRIAVDGASIRLSQECISILSELSKVPGLPVKIILRGDDPADGISEEFLAKRFASAGLDLNSIERLSPGDSLETLLEKADLLLDTMPVPSVEAVFMALRMGVPVQSVYPENAANSASYSLLKSIGLQQWIARDMETAVQRIITLGQDEALYSRTVEELQTALEKASGVEVRQKRGGAFADLFDDLLAKAAEDVR